MKNAFLEKNVLKHFLCANKNKQTFSLVDSVKNDFIRKALNKEKIPLSNNFIQFSSYI